MQISSRESIAAVIHRLCSIENQDTLQQCSSRELHSDAAAVVFVFPLASGHLNPSLAVARQLVGKGVTVHYLADIEVKCPILATGATFHDVSDWETEYFGERDSKCNSLTAMARCMEQSHIFT
eukprot:scaffold348263_cov45-Prasinocladus_malaysianus.AAC.1